MKSIIDGVHYGPLAQLIGKWSGFKGVDKAPNNQGNTDRSKFMDELTFTVAGVTTNAEEQVLVAVKYHHVVRHTENGLIFHDQIGHWFYEPSNGNIMHSLTIPRAVCVLAGGKFEEKDGETTFTVKAEAGSDTFGILQSPFLMEKAKTKAFTMKLSVKKNELKYHEVTSLHIYNTDYEHVDYSTLHRVVYDLD